MKLFDEIPYLENDRLVLKKITETDSPALKEMCEDKNVRRYLPTFLTEYQFNNANEAISCMYNETFKNKESLFLGIYMKPDLNEMAGIIEIYNYVPYWNKASLGYRLSQKYWGKGIATSAAKLILDYLLSETDVKRITAHVMCENSNSSNILLKLGFSLRKHSVLEDWGFENPVEVNKYIYEKWGSISYQKIGNGSKTMVILPGLALKSTLGAAEEIAKNFKMFSDYTIYLFDDRSLIGENYTLRERSDDIAMEMHNLGLEDAYVYGASMGGMVGQYLAMDFPNLVKKLFITSTCSRMNSKSTEILTKWKMLAEKNDIENLNKDMFQMIYSQETVKKYGNLFFSNKVEVTPDDLEKFIKLIDAILNVDTYIRLDKIQCPVCVTTALGDRVLTSDASVEIAEKLNCQIYIYGKEYGHAVYDEAPDHNQKILEFFEA